MSTAAYAKARDIAALKTIRFLGLDLHCISYQEMFARFDQWINSPDGRGYSVALINVNCCVSGLLSPDIRAVYQRADLLGIDSMPFVYIARLLKDRRSDRLYGPDVMLETAREAPQRGYKFFLYGGVPGAPEAMSALLKEMSPRLTVAGTFSPPFRELTQEEDDAICRIIADSGANIVWVGLGSPKQDIWIERHRHKLPGCILIASGATFDFFSGRIRQAPLWIQKAGMEWLFRLFQDPVRLWKRYTVYNVLFAGALILEILGVLRLGESHAARASQPAASRVKTPNIYRSLWSRLAKRRNEPRPQGAASPDSSNRLPAEQRSPGAQEANP
jgi:N-acetylglucosaminyldiphosphoundecaprenol N-acetyl-beta-D-mannosaminyltransferase